MSNSNPLSLAFGIATQNSRHEIIEVYYPAPVFEPDQALTKGICKACDMPFANGSKLLDNDDLNAVTSALTETGNTELTTQLETLQSSSQIVLCVLVEDAPPVTVEEAYLKLHLLSHRYAKPHALNLEGLFAVLPNNAWTSQGAIALEDLPQRQLQARLQGEFLDVISVDKFPKMTSYVVPAGVRIADTARVRLGAYLGAGTTIMHEGFVNFNAGTEGPAMIEGRISAGVMIGADSDLGGSSSTMGTLSGGGKEIISVGKNCLIGANAGIGIPLADGCTVEAGLYVTAGTKIKVLNAKQELQSTVKAKELIGTPNLLFRRNSINGAVEVLPLKSTVELNTELHSHN